jgi:pimeloyl-ACP methyl ester carboxylesterase
MKLAGLTHGGLDHWDPSGTDGFAEDRPLILFNNAGVVGSSGDTPEIIDAMAHHSAAFLGALGISRADVLGFSMASCVVQSLTLRQFASGSQADPRRDRTQGG